MMVVGPDRTSDYPVVTPPMNAPNSVGQLILPTIDALPKSAGPIQAELGTSIPKHLHVERDPLALVYFSRLEARGASRSGFKAYRYQLESILRIASRLCGKTVSLYEVFQDEALLGAALTNDVAPVQGGTLSKWTLAQRRSAIRSFGALVRPELRKMLQIDPLEQIDTALRRSAERVGIGYRLSGGTPRQRGGYVPTPSEIALVVEEAGNISGYRGLRNQVFFEILVRTGTRVNALRNLDGSDCVEMPSGKLRLFVHDKGKLEPRELELNQELSTRLIKYVSAFNQFAAGRRWRTRIRLGEPGPIWRNSSRGSWPYNSVRETLRQACTEVGVPPFSPHALRRAFATDATSVLPRHVVALAGGWQGVERLDNHYVHPRQHEIWRKLAGNASGRFDQLVNEQDRDAPAVVS